METEHAITEMQTDIISGILHFKVVFITIHGTCIVYKINTMSLTRIYQLTDFFWKLFEMPPVLVVL